MALGKTLVAAVLALALGGCGSVGGVGSVVGGSLESMVGGLGNIALGGDPGEGRPSEVEIGRGLREALRVGTDRVVDTLGVGDGYFSRPDVHIPLPGALADVDRALGAIGMNQLTRDLELRLNRAAEAAVPQARTLFWNAIADLRLDDLIEIYRGSDTAATEYFRRSMSAPLANAMRPIVDRAMGEVGAISAYEDAVAQYREIPLVPDAKGELVSFVLDRTISGMFLYLGREEARIRHDPLARTTDILRRVFGN